ncbi:hypothetical protein AZI87_13865 [Bdellovibrio bacteriovorus]|uniref:Acyltransferase 3 domain-containing protein n=1 Tax=Bdellovibrio bacteriovorus TaxID=959 RepID=A0A161PQ22_BDEBC|nr:acyltransferase family protein [Bdellovibrio bacteriovorus]KYG64316.1 hypothetical protein AZI87_13865 [Bdellovibrio bacteriovorus]
MERIRAIDLARGIAVVLMILSHGIKGLVPFEEFPSWGLVPIHLLTKGASTCFFLVFGITLAVAFVPAVDREDWPQKRKRLFFRGLKILFWYKVLCIVEMFSLYERQEILDVLLYRAFAVYSEILGFYGIALLWIPFFLPLWKKLRWWGQLICIGFTTYTAIYLFNNFDFGSVGLKAILVEHEDFYTWGQLTRLPIVMVGLMLGEMTRKCYESIKRRMILAASVFAGGLLLAVAFVLHAPENLQETLISLAMNEGKHPPDASFMLFSMALAFFIVSLSLAGGNLLALVLKPVTIIGSDALGAFVFHIFVIFVFYRYLFDYWHKITYQHALNLTLLLILLTAIWIRVKNWISKES